AYLEPWAAAGESRADLIRQAALARQGGCLLRALGGVRALGSPEAARRWGFAGAPAEWLGALAAALAPPGSDPPEGVLVAVG
ncbi:MAG: hypothetical protein ACLGIF_05935, partial [Actinomycetes bacterium]